MLKRILCSISAIMLILCVFPVFVPAAARDIPIRTDITADSASDTDENTVSLNVTVTNVSGYNVFGVNFPLTGQDGLAFASRDFGGTDKLAPGESFTAKIVCTITDGSAADKKGCGSTLAFTGIAAAILIAVSVFARKKRKKLSVLLLAFMLIASVPTVSLAESAADADVPSVTLTGTSVTGSDPDYRMLEFRGKYTDGGRTEVYRTEIGSGKKTVTAEIAVGYSEYGNFSVKVLALPVKGLGTLPKDKNAVTDAQTLGAEIPVELSAGSSILATYPERIYAKNSKTEFKACAYLTYEYRGESVTVRSEPLTGSIFGAAGYALENSSLTQEQKDSLEKDIIGKAGQASVLSGTDEDSLRQGIVDRMEQMASIRWKSKNTVNTAGMIGYSTPSYRINREYSGLIYNMYHYGTAEHFSYLLDANGYLDEKYTKDAQTIWSVAPGVSCSTSITGSYAYFCCGLEEHSAASDMFPVNKNTGFSPIGDYSVPRNAQTTDDIIAANREQDIYRAFAQMKKADILDSVWKESSGSVQGHVIMARENPTVVCCADGTVDPEKSRIKTIEQNTDVITVDGVMTTWQHREFSFYDLIHGPTKYVPIRYTDLTADYSVPAYCIITGMDTDSILRDGLSGKLESDFPIRYFGVTVTDADGKPVFDRKTSPSSSYAKTVTLSIQTDINNSLKAIAPGTYRVKITACVKNEERVLLDTVITK